MEKIGQDFLMDEALDLPTNLKRTASTKKYKKIPHFSAANEALKYKICPRPNNSGITRLLSLKKRFSMFGLKWINL